MKKNRVGFLWCLTKTGSEGFARRTPKIFSLLLNLSINTAALEMSVFELSPDLPSAIRFSSTLERAIAQKPSLQTRSNASEPSRSREILALMAGFQRTTETRHFLTYICGKFDEKKKKRKQEKKKKSQDKKNQSRIENPDACVSFSRVFAGKPNYSFLCRVDRRTRGSEERKEKKKEEGGT